MASSNRAKVQVPYKNGMCIVTDTQIIWARKGGNIDQKSLRDITSVEKKVPVYGVFRKKYQYLLHLYSPSWYGADYTEFHTEADLDRVLMALREAMLD